MKISSLPYLSNIEQLFSHLLDYPWPCFLDSCQPQSAQGRYDIISADPYIQITTNENISTVKTRESTRQLEQDPFHLLKQYIVKQPVKSPLPFIGGAIGYFSYDAGRWLENIPRLAENDNGYPQMQVGIYDWAIIVDHESQQSYYVENHNDPAPNITLALIKGLLAKEKKAGKKFELQRDWQANMSYDEYALKFNKIKNYILSGDCYQINLTQRFHNRFQGDPWQAYQELRTHNAAPYSAFLNFDEFHILSCSPERFLKVEDNIVETKPMKGTRPRHSDAKKDNLLANELYKSEKDRAENLMIVDLMRNDISKCCLPHSVTVPSLFGIESFEGVHQMVTTINGTLAPEYTAIDLLKNSFPGGSITGTPKIRAMEIIEELEPHRRSIYCGSIGYISYHGRMDTNIAIRTLYGSNNNLYLSAGGGIVADSEVQSEYKECFTKVNKILNIFGVGFQPEIFFDT